MLCAGPVAVGLCAVCCGCGTEAVAVALKLCAGSVASITVATNCGIAMSYWR